MPLHAQHGPQYVEHNIPVATIEDIRDESHHSPANPRFKIHHYMPLGNEEEQLMHLNNQEEQQEDNAGRHHYNISCDGFTTVLESNVPSKCATSLRMRVETPRQGETTSRS